MGDRNEALDHFLKTGELMDSKTFRERRGNTRGGARGSSRGQGGTGRTSSLYFTDNDDDLAGLSTGRSRWVKAARRAIKSREGGERPAQQPSARTGGRPPPQPQRYGRPPEVDEDEEEAEEEGHEEREREETYAEEEHPSGPHVSATAAQRRPLLRAPRVSLKTSLARSSITSLSSEPDTFSPPVTPSMDTRKKTLFESVAEELPSDADVRPPPEAIREVSEREMGAPSGQGVRKDEGEEGEAEENAGGDNKADEKEEDAEEASGRRREARGRPREEEVRSGESEEETAAAASETSEEDHETQLGRRTADEETGSSPPPPATARGPTISATARGTKEDGERQGSEEREMGDMETEPAGAAVNESATRTVSPAPRVTRDSLEGSEHEESEQGRKREEEKEEEEDKEDGGREEERKEQVDSGRKETKATRASDEQQQQQQQQGAAATSAPQTQPAASNVPLTLSAVGPPGAQMQNFEDFFGDMSLSEASTSYPSRPTTRDGVQTPEEKPAEAGGAAGEAQRQPVHDVDRQREEERGEQLHKIEEQQENKEEAESERQRRREGRTSTATTEQHHHHHHHHHHPHQQDQPDQQEQKRTPTQRDTTPSMIPKRRQRRPITAAAAAATGAAAAASSLASPLKSTESGSRLPVARRYAAAGAGAERRGAVAARKGEEVNAQEEDRHVDDEALQAAMADREEVLRHWREADAARASREQSAVEAYAVDHKVKALQHQVKVLTAMVEAGAKQQRNEEETQRIVDEQEGMLANFQRENDRLYKLIKQGDGTTKHMLAHMHAENERLAAENFTLRSRNEVLEQQLAGAGAISNARVAELEGQLTAVAADKNEREEMLQQRCALLEKTVQQLEDKCSQLQAMHREYERATVAPLQETMDALRTEKAELRQRVEELKEEAKRARAEAAAAKHDTQSQQQQRTGREKGKKGEGHQAEVVAREQAAAHGGGHSAEGTAGAAGRDAAGGVFEALMSETARDAHTVLRMKLAEKTKEAQQLQERLAAQKVKMQDKVSAFQQQMADMRSEFKAHTAQLEARLREATSSSATRPHTRVKELEQELEALRRRYRHADEASAGHDEDRRAIAALRSERDALKGTVSRLERDVQDMRELRGKYESAKAAWKDLEQRLEAALALAEDHRKAKQFAEEKARVASRQLQRDFAAKVSALERRVEEKEQREAAVSELQQMVHTLSRKLETAPTHEQVALYERSIRDLELQVRDKEAELSVARKYHTPAMQHYDLLLQRIAELEAKQREREQQVKDLVVQRDRSRTLEMEDVNNKWRQAFLEKASQVTSLRERVEEMTNVLKLLKARGVRIPNPMSIVTP